MSGAWVRQIRNDLHTSGALDTTSDFASQAAKSEAGRQFLQQNPGATTGEVASAANVSPPKARKIRRDWQMRKEVEWEPWMEGQTLYPYIGSKEKITGWILWKVPEYERFENPKRYTRLPEHRTFVEVFGGSATLLYNKPPSEVEVYNDWNEDYSHFIKTLRDHGWEIERFLEGIPYTREQYEDWTRKWYDADWRPKDDVKRAAVFFFNRFTQRLAKDDRTAGYRRPTGNRPQPEDYYNGRDRLPEFQKRFSRDDPEYFQQRFDLPFTPHLNGPVEVVENNKESTEKELGLDYSDVLDEYDAADALFYLDPPYVDKEAYYPVSGDFDHNALVEKVTGLKGEFILSYGEALPDGLDDYRREILEHPTGKRTEHLLFSYPEENEGTFDPPTRGGDARTSDW